MDLMIVDKAERYLRQLAPHVATREGAVLLADTKAEIVALRTGVNECYRMLLTEPNTKLALDKAESMLRDLMTPNDKHEARLAVALDAPVGRGKD